MQAIAHQPGTLSWQLPTQGLQTAIPKDRVSNLSKRISKGTIAGVVRLTSIVCIRVEGDLNDSKTVLAHLHNHTHPLHLPLHFCRIVSARVLLYVSCWPTATPLLECRPRFVFILYIRSLETTPWLFFMTILGAILFHLSSGKIFLGMFPAKKVLQRSL